MIDNGYAATSVDQVIAASGSSKGAFFHHFESKRALADALVDRYVDVRPRHLAGRAGRGARAASDDPAERAIAFLRYFEDMADELMLRSSRAASTPRSSPSASCLPPAHPTRSARPWSRGARATPPCCATRCPDGADVDALSDHVFVTFEGAFLLARATGDPSHMRRQLRTLRELLTAALAQSARR